MADKIDIQIKATGGDAAAAEMAKPIAAMEKTAATIEKLAAEMGVDIGKGYGEALTAAMEGATPEMIAAVEKQQDEIFQILARKKWTDQMNAIGRMQAEADLRDYEQQVEAQAKATEEARDAFQMGSEEARRFREHVAEVGGESGKTTDRLDQLLKVLGKMPGPVGDTARELGGVVQALGAVGRGAGLIGLVVTAATAGAMAVKKLTEWIGNARQIAEADLPEMARLTRDVVTPAEAAATAYKGLAESLQATARSRADLAREMDAEARAIDALAQAQLREREAEIDLAEARGEMTPDQARDAKVGARRATEDESVARQRRNLEAQIAMQREIQARALADYRTMARPDGAMAAARDALIAAQGRSPGQEPSLRPLVEESAAANARFAKASQRPLYGVASEAEVKAMEAARTEAETARQALVDAQAELIETRQKEFDALVEQFRAVEAASAAASQGLREAEDKLRQFDEIGGAVRGTNRRAEDLNSQAERERAAQNQSVVPESVINAAQAALTMADRGQQPVVTLLSQLTSALQDGTDAPELRGWIDRVQALLESGIGMAAGDRARIQQLEGRLAQLQSQIAAGRSYD